MRKRTITAIRISCISLLLAFASPTTIAQDEEQGNISTSPPPSPPAARQRVSEEMLVTGSYIKGLTQESLASPVQSIGRGDILDIGAVRMEDVINNLTINTGSENNPDAFTQNFTTGTSNINLRGLGVASTLVLLNGRRQTYSAFTTDKGENFVDTSGLVPLIAVERIEILKGGAASLYGSDAVAGVANFITRNGFEGFEFQVEALSGDSQGDLSLSGLYGADFGNARLIAAFSHLTRDGLGTDERRLSRVEDDTSRAGFPGTFLLPVAPMGPTDSFSWNAAYNANGNHPFIADFFEPLLGLPEVPNALQPAFADPDCSNIAQTDNTTLPPEPTPLPAPLGACQYDFGENFALVPDEERTQLYSHLDIQFTESLNFFVELALADNSAERRNSPAFPITTTPVVCGDGSLDPLLGSSCAALGPHPDNPYGVDVLFVGRVRGSGSDPMISNHDSKTTRLATGLSGSITETWSWNVDLTSSRNEFDMRAEDTLANEFQRALVGLGGEDCVGTPGLDIFPGMGSCSYFNPFGSSLIDGAGAGTDNSEAIYDYITGDLTIDAEAELNTLSGLATGDLFEMAGGNAGLAVGAQLRQENLDYDYDENANNNNFIFFRGNPDFDGDRDIKAVFSELAMPVLDNLDIQLSVRYEDYEDSGSSTDPKVGVLYHPTENLGLRATLGTSFRAPSLFQQEGIQTTLVEIRTPTLGKQFLPVRAQPDPNDPLEPEEADVMNIGASWTNDTQAFEVSLDYWVYDYENVIIQQNPQAILNAATANNPDPQAASQIEFSPIGISRINVYYDNASTLETDGIDLRTSYTWADTSTGLYRLGLELTKVMSYDLVDPQAGPIDGLGKRNFENFASSVPEMRANLHFLWSYRQHAVNAFVRHIDSYINDQLDLQDQPKNQPIDAHTTVDLQYSYLFNPIGNAVEGITLSIGGINVTDENPPYVSTNGGYDSKVHDPRGALYYVRATVPF